MDVSVIIVNWNTRKLLRKCLQSIRQHTKGVLYEVFVVDNNSNDGSCEMVKEEFTEYNLIQSNENLGFCRANNHAIKYSMGKYILFLNPDTELMSNAINTMQKLLEMKPEVGAVGCKLVYPNGSIQYVCARTFPTPFNQFCFLVGLDRIFPKSKTFSSVEMKCLDHNLSREVECLSGACMMVRRELIQQLSGFDEKIFMYAEDVDLCFRIKKIGWKIYYISEEFIIHYSGESSKQQKKQFFSVIEQKKSNLYFMDKHFGRKKAKQFIISVFVGSIFRSFSILILYPFIIMIKTVREKVAPHALIKYLKIFLWSCESILKF